MENRAAYLVGARKIEIRPCPMPIIDDDSVGIRIKDIGICGTDLHKYKSGHVSGGALPWILGHEAGGVVYEVGKNVRHLAVGDRVAIEPGHPCGKCETCKSGRYNLCTSVRFLAAAPYPGVLCEYISYPASLAFKLPDNVSTMEGALVEPLSVGLHATARGDVRLGQTIAILGGGSIGMCTLLSAKARGASRIIVVDLFESHLKKALELGATDVVNASECDAVQALLQLTDGRGADIVFETAGCASTMAQTCHVVKVGGTIVAVGDVMGDVSYCFRNIYLREAQIIGVFRYCNTYPTAINAIASGAIDIKQIVSSEFGFEHTQEAFEAAAFDKTNCIKAVVHL